MFHELLALQVLKIFMSENKIDKKWKMIFYVYMKYIFLINTIKTTLCLQSQWCFEQFKYVENEVYNHVSKNSNGKIKRYSDCFTRNQTKIIAEGNVVQFLYFLYSYTGLPSWTSSFSTWTIMFSWLC